MLQDEANFTKVLPKVINHRLTLKLKLEFWRYFGVKLFGTVWDIMGFYEQNRVLAINTKVLFYM